MAVTLKDIRSTSEKAPTPISDAARASIADALAAIPSGKSGAVLAFVGDDGTIHGVGAAKLGGHWTLFASAEYHVAEKNFDGLAGVQFSW